MTRPGNKILEFASRSSERGKQRESAVARKRIALHLDCSPIDAGDVSGVCATGTERHHGAPADSLCSSSPINAHKRKDGTFNNGPRFEVSETLAHAVFTVVFVVGLAASCMWFYHTFLEAETAIIHSISSKGGK